MNKEKVCVNCFYFEKIYYSGYKGKCWRFPPQVTTSMIFGIESVHPEVKENDYCGEFKKKES